MARFAKRFCVLTMALFCGVSIGWARQSEGQGQAQQQTSTGQQTTPKTGTAGASSPQMPQQPLSQAPTGQQQSSAPATGQETQANATPLTGVEQYTLSHMGVGESYFAPSFQFAQSVSTNGVGAFGASDVQSVSTLSGVMAFNHFWGRYNLTAQYSGTGFLYNQDSQYNTSAHEFTLSQRIQGRRSSLLVSDVVDYLPEASFGFARFSGFSNYGGVGFGYGGLFGAGGGNLDTTFLPNQSIFTGPSSRVSNSVIGEYDYLTSPLSSLTVTASYALLRFPSSDYINSDDVIARIGYNRTLTRKNSIGLSYEAAIFRFNRPDSDFVNHAASITYRYTFTNRLGLQLGAGPQINVFNYSVPGQDTRVSWQASAWLNYQLRRSEIGLNYQHFTSGGSGVYLGARTDDIGAYFSVPLSRLWAFDTDMGYAYNTTVQGGNLTGVGRSYNSWYGTANIHRVLSRSLSMFLSYNLQQQIAATPTCIGSTCGTFYTQQYFSFGFNWHPALAGIE